MKNPMIQFGLAILLMVLLAFLFGAMNTYGVFNEAAAGWAQAVFTVVAIYGAAYLASLHHDRVASDSARDQLIAARNLADIAVRYVKDLEMNGMSEQKEHGYKHFAVGQNALDAIPLAQFQFPSLIQQIVDIKHHYYRYRTLFEDRGGDAKVRAACLLESHKVLQSRFSRLDKAARDRGGEEGADGALMSPSEKPPKGA